MKRLGVKADYEELRNARILENTARLASLGLQKTVAELRSISSKPQSEKRKRNKVDYFLTPLRRSNRLKGKSSELALRRSDRLNENSRRTTVLAKMGLFEDGDDVEKRPANAPLLRMKDGLMVHLTPEALARRCTSKDRGSIYDPVLGICCHFCRQKKLCGEEVCKRCGDLDMDQPCLGKTDCSICHSSKGVLCRGCLKVRYGEEMEDVRANKEWICPHCTEEKGINPYWICNSSLCLKKRKMAPTGIAIFRAREMGYKSVAHLLMDQLQGSVKGYIVEERGGKIAIENLNRRKRRENRHSPSMRRLRMKADYEEVRKAQILENQARLASLGVQKIIGELRTKSQSEKRKNNKADYFSAPLRRSNRLKGNSAPSPKKGGLKYLDLLSPEALAQRSNRLKVAVRCHFCNEKELCDEEDCKRCGDLDTDQPCLGKTDCSICHSSNGVLCQGCLKNRYGEELEEVRANKGWVCPHCTEETGINPYWICNNSQCLKKRNMAPTRNTFEARKMGYKSVAHLIMDQLQGAVKRR